MTKSKDDKSVRQFGKYYTIVKTQDDDVVLVPNQDINEKNNIKGQLDGKKNSSQMERAIKVVEMIKNGSLLDEDKIVTAITNGRIWSLIEELILDKYGQLMMNEIQVVVKKVKR